MKEQAKHLLSDADFKAYLKDILAIVANYCEEHNLSYFLAYGTLLGAVRHKGFIPWDDDIDIIMPRADYNQFIKYFNQSQDRYQVIDLSINEKYYLPFAKVCDTYTSLKEPVRGALDLGVYVDIFPMDGLGNDKEKACKLLRSLAFTQNLINAKLNPWHKSRSFVRNLICSLISFFPVSIQTLCRRIEAAGRLLSTVDEKYKGVMFYKENEIFNAEWFASSEMLPFEGKLYRVPIGYHELLRTWYGDYMKLPPVEQQIGLHDLKAYRIEGNK